MKRSSQLLVSFAALGLAAWACTFQVNENETVIVARLGDPSRTVAEAGLAFKLPPPIDTLIRVDRRIRILEPDAVEYLTQDKKNVLVSCYLAWSVDDPIAYIQRARDLAAAEAQLGDIALAELNNIVGSYPISALVSTEDGPKHMRDLNAELTTSIDTRAKKDFGVHVHCARIKRLNYPRQNKEAVFRRMEAERNKIAAEIRSQGQERAEKIRADAAKEAAMLMNEAAQRAETLRGEGEAEAIRISGAAYAKDPEFYEFQRTLQAYEKIFNESTTFVIPVDAPLLRHLKPPPSAGKGSAAPSKDAPRKGKSRGQKGG